MRSAGKMPRAARCASSASTFRSARSLPHRADPTQRPNSAPGSAPDGACCAMAPLRCDKPVELGLGPIRPEDDRTGGYSG